MGTALLVASTIYSLTASASPMTAVLRLQEKVAIEQLAEFVKSPNSPMTRGYTAQEIRQISAPEDQE